MMLVAEDLRLTVAGYGTVVPGFSACFASEEVVGVTGPSGAGKSTLARGLCGIQPAAGGRVYIDGAAGTCRPGVGGPGAAAVQLGFQNALSTFPPHLRLEVPLLDAARAGPAGDRAARLGGGAGVAARRELAALLAELGIPAGLLRRRPREVSGGQLQRLALARAIAVRPQFLVCDEITSSVDPVTERRVLGLLGRYRRNHELGIVLISHDIGLLARNCDRVIVMDRGVAVEAGDPRTVFSYPEHPTTMALARAHITGGTL